MKIIESFNEFNDKLDNVKKAKEEASKIKDGIRKLIENLPDNKKINRLSSNSFTMSSKDMNISKSLDPFYYDFKAQYKKISEYLNKCDIENFIEKFNEIIEKGHFTMYTGSKNIHGDSVKTKYILNPEVINNLKSLI